MQDLTTSALIDTLRDLPDLTERELVLLDRLIAAIDEVEALYQELGRHLSNPPT